MDSIYAFTDLPEPSLVFKSRWGHLGEGREIKIHQRNTRPSWGHEKIPPASREGGACSGITNKKNPDQQSHLFPPTGHLDPGSSGNKQQNRKRKNTEEGGEKEEPI